MVRKIDNSNCIAIVLAKSEIRDVILPCRDIIEGTCALDYRARQAMPTEIMANLCLADQRELNKS